MIKGTTFKARYGNQEILLQNVDWGSEIIAALPEDREFAHKYGQFGKYFLKLSPEEQKVLLDEYYNS